MSARREGRERVLEAETQTDDATPRELLLDPFSFFPGVASRVLGLGGNAPGYDPTYAFHTPYVEAAPGRAHFILRFRGLVAKRGTLQLWVHMLPTETGANARVVNSERIQLNRLIQQGGQHLIPFESFRGVSFALHGAIVDNTDAEAESLVVAMDRPLDPRSVTAAVEARSSSYGREQTRPAVHLISDSTATLRQPVSQCATDAQLREKVAGEALSRLGLSAAKPLDRWRLAYLARVFDCYGMLSPGARGLGFEHAHSPLSAALRECGPEIILATSAEEAAGAVRVDPTAIPHDLVNFDFLWSHGIGAQLSSPRAMMTFVESTIECLRPGGLAVHMLPFDADGDRFSYPDGRGPFTRNDVEQLALIMITRGHQIAQIKVDTKLALGAYSSVETDFGAVMISEFGLIARRAPSAI